MAENGQFIFITGGCRSGKSAFGEQLAGQLGGDRAAYVATARVLDDEMRQRVEAHRRRRPGAWATYEEPLDLVSLLVKIDGRYPVILIDCITMWVSNHLFRQEKSDVLAQAKCLAETVKFMKSGVIMVSGEVGWGLIGESLLSRQFVDLLGSVNQVLAAAADDAYLTVAGMPLKLKERGELLAWQKK